MTSFLFHRLRASQSYKLLGLVLLLLAELECLLVSNYPIRTALRAAFGIPLYHILLTFLTIAGLVRWLRPQDFTLPAGVRLSGPWLCAHGLVWLLLWFGVEPLWAMSRAQAAWQIVLLWGGLGLVLLGTWLHTWLPVSRWSALWFSVRGWVGFALAVSFLVPYGAIVASQSWLSLARLTFVLTELLLGLVFADTIARPEQLLLGTSRFVVEIHPGCSGYEGMGLIAAFVCVYLWLKRKELRFPRAWVVLPLSIVVAYYANVLRLLILIAIGTTWSQDVAMKGFHSQAGWFSFTVLSIAVIYTIEKSGYFKSRETFPEPDDYPALPFLAPLMGLLFSTMAVQGLTAEFEFVYALKPLTVGLLVMYFWPRLRGSLQIPNWSLSLGAGILVYLVWIVSVKPAVAISPFEVLSAPLACLWIFFRILGGAVCVPMAEELAFRGYLMRRLQEADFEKAAWSPARPLAMGGSSLLFAALHQEFLPALFAGLVYAGVCSRRGHLSNAIIAHAVTNGLLATQAVLRGDWWLW